MGKSLGIAVLAAGLAAGAVQAGELETRDFEVFRNGEPIGHHRVVIDRDGDVARVKIDIGLRITFGPLTLFRYLHQAEEVWHGDRLQALKSVTDNDGTAETLEVTADSETNDLKVTGTRFSGRLPADAMPTSYWRSDFVSRATIMDSQNGRVLALRVQPEPFEMASALRNDVPVRRYHLQGDIDLTLWYDQAGHWVKAAFPGKDGSRIEYRLR